MAGLLKLAKLPRSTFYYQQKVLQTADKYQQLKDQICVLFERHRGRYGYRRVTADLRQFGSRINHKLVQRLMGVLGLRSPGPTEEIPFIQGRGRPNCASRVAASVQSRSC